MYIGTMYIGINKSSSILLKSFHEQRNLDNNTIQQNFLNVNRRKTL